MIEIDDNNSLVSEAIRDQLPEIEEAILAQIKDRYVTVKIFLDGQQNEVIVAGSLVGISVEDSIKIDVRTKLEVAYVVTTDHLRGMEYICKGLVLDLGSSSTHLEGERGVISPKMYDFDHENMLCTLGLDLVRLSKS